MSRSVNRLILLGHVGNDPEMRTTQGGTAVATFSLATNTGWTDDTGKKQERTQWHRIIAWDALADIVGKYVQKGKQLYVEGRVDYRQWNDKDGIVRYSTEVVAHEVILLGAGGQNERTEQRAADAPEVARAARAKAAEPAPAPAAPATPGKRASAKRTPF